MEIRVKRLIRTNKSTIGSLYIDGIFQCYTLEDTDRGLKSTLPLGDIKQAKVKGETAIPTGEYKVVLDVISPRFSKVATYNSILGKVPRLLDVKGFDGVLIHIGNYPKDTDGCILVGNTKGTEFIGDSKTAFFALYNKLKTAEGIITLIVE